MEIAQERRREKASRRIDISYSLGTLGFSLEQHTWPKSYFSERRLWRPQKKRLFPNQRGPRSYASIHPNYAWQAHVKAVLA